ncbi:hypothetical protein FSB08_38030 [Paraburkholderia sp. JPY432]|uniref:hypothetical protein n=1 Tax=Paraburkholderia youngii TaxID=2782701 RepID=UPI001595CB4A|nr:hypothetical protein [Paraburkholderia youngii]NVH78110.1 hypothetical protein [Paraburkholderia youngii]
MVKKLKCLAEVFCWSGSALAIRVRASQHWYPFCRCKFDLEMSDEGLSVLSAHPALAVAVLASVTSMAAGSAQAQVTAVNNYWNGTSSSDWFNASNWIDNGGDHLVPDFRTNTTFINTLTSNRTIIDGLAAPSRIVRIGDGASSGSNGSLNIQNGGTLDVLTNSGGGYVAVGYGTPNPSIAALTVTGAGSRLSAAGYMYVALFDANQGTMNVQNGALVEAGVSLDVAGGRAAPGSSTWWGRTRYCG